MAHKTIEKKTEDLDNRIIANYGKLKDAIKKELLKFSNGEAHLTNDMYIAWLDDDEANINTGYADKIRNHCGFLDVHFKVIDEREADEWISVEEFPIDKLIEISKNIGWYIF